MAGYVNAKTKLAEQSSELERLRVENKRLRARLAAAGLSNESNAKRIVSRTYDDRVIGELIDWSEEGLFLDECFAQWGIDADTWAKWLEDHVELREAVGPSRARARAAMLRILREGLKTRNAFPTSLADRIIAMTEKEHGSAEQESSALVALSFCPRCAAADAQSPDDETQVIDLAST